MAQQEVQPSNEVFTGQVQEVGGFRIGVCAHRSGLHAAYIAFRHETHGWVTYILDPEQTAGAAASFQKAADIIATRNKTKTN